MPQDNKDDKLFEVGRETEDLTAGMSPQDVSKAVRKLMALPVRPPQQGIAERMAMRNQSPFTPHQSAPELEGVDLSRFDERLRHTVR